MGIAYSGLSFFSNGGTSSKWVYNSAGILVNVAAGSLAVDYNPATLAARGLLIEPASSNLQNPSSAFDDALWAKGGCTIGANAVAAPNGLTEADALIPAGAGVAYVNRAGGTDSGVLNTFSLFLKNGTLGTSWMRIATLSPTYEAYFNLAAGVKGTSTGSPTSYTIKALPSGWYRVTLTITPSSTSTPVYLATAAGDGDPGAVTGDGVRPAFYLWGAQMEPGAFASSPIPTLASTITRAADNVTCLLSSIPALGSAYSIYVRFSTPDVASSRHAIVATDGTVSEFVGFAANATARLAVVDGGSAVGAISQGAIVADVAASVAGRFKANDCALSTAGAAAAFDTTVTLPTVTQLRFGGDGSNAATTAPFWIEKLAIVPRAWSNAELATRSAA